MTRETELANNERLLFKAAETAYFKAGKTSDPQDWLEAGLLAQQHRNALTGLRHSQQPEVRSMMVAVRTIHAMDGAADMDVKFLLDYVDSVGRAQWPEIIKSFRRQIIAVAAETAVEGVSTPQPEVREACCRAHGPDSACFCPPHRRKVLWLASTITSHATGTTYKGENADNVRLVVQMLIDEIASPPSPQAVKIQSTTAQAEAPIGHAISGEDE